MNAIGAQAVALAEEFRPEAERLLRDLIKACKEVGGRKRGLFVCLFAN